MLAAISRLIYSNSVETARYSRESLFLGVTTRRDLSEGMPWPRKIPI
jgi:hypothetical protein